MPAPAQEYRDSIYLRNLHVIAIVGKDAWQRPSKSQPILLSIRLFTDITVAAESDDINKTTSYGKICKDVQNFIDAKRSFDHLLDLNISISDLASTMKWGGTDLHIISLAPKALLMAEGGLQLLTVFKHLPGDAVDPSTHRVMRDTAISVHGLKCACIIGVNPHERLKKQVVVVSLNFALHNSAFVVNMVDDWMSGEWVELVEKITLTIEESSFETLEALATEIADVGSDRQPFMQTLCKRITVSVEKPSALAFVDGAGVEITRAL